MKLIKGKHYFLSQSYIMYLDSITIENDVVFHVLFTKIRTGEWQSYIELKAFKANWNEKTNELIFKQGSKVGKIKEISDEKLEQIKKEVIINSL